MLLILKTDFSTYRIHLINGCISFHSCQILSLSETSFIVSAQTDLHHPVGPDSYTVVARGVADLDP